MLCCNTDCLVTSKTRIDSSEEQKHEFNEKDQNPLFVTKGCYGKYSCLSSYPQ